MIKTRINLRQIETNLYIINNNSTTIYIDENELDYNNKCNLNHKIIYNLIKDIKTNYKENDKEKGWYIKDGNLEGKKSTNDTWFYLAEDTLIYDQMIIKTNHNLFKCLCK